MVGKQTDNSINSDSFVQALKIHVTKIQNGQVWAATLSLSRC